MFGYVRPYVPQLKVAEYEMYRAVYCGLCRAMGRATGQASRLTLSYDFTILAAVRMILEDIPPETAHLRCVAHPAKKRAYVRENPALTYAAAMSALLAQLKNQDDLADEAGLRRIRAAIIAPPVSYMRKRGERLLVSESESTAADSIAAFLSALSGLERENCDSLDKTAETFGSALAFVFSCGLDGDAARLASEIGRHMGRFVYVCDAADDLAEDIKRKRYNPIAAGWGELAVGADGKMTELVRGSIETSLPLDLEGLGAAVERLAPAHPLTPIIKNIVYLGLPAAMRRVLYTDAGEPSRKACRSG